MQFPTMWRKLALTAHITSSVGWLGAVVAFLALAIAGIRTVGDEHLRGAYLAMEVVGWFVIIPFSAATLITGVVQSLGTSWGLFRHYWVVAKLLISVGASFLLLLHMQVVGAVAEAATAGSLHMEHLRDPRMQLIADAGAATVVLLVAIGLSVYKPKGRTSFGRLQAEDALIIEKATPMAYAFWIAMAVLLIAFVVRHLSGGMPSHF